MRLRLATIFTTLLVVLVTLGMAGLGYMSYAKARDGMASDLSAQAAQAAKRLSGSLAAAVWNMESDNAEKIIAAELDARAVMAILVEEPDGSPSPDWPGTPRAGRRKLRLCPRANAS